MSVLRRPAVAAVLLALTAVGLHTGLRTGGRVAALAAETDPFADGDQDMVPDCIELLANTDPASADTDEDGIDDFEEILTFTSHDPNLKAQPVDYSIRVLVTSTPHPSGPADVHLHVMLRFVNLKMSEVTIHDFYANTQGVDVSLMQLLGHGEIKIAHRERERDGVSYLFSFRLASAEDIYRILPCTIGVRAVLGGKRFNAGSLLLPTGSDMAAVMPYRAALILQPINTAVYIQDANPYYNGAGRVCEMGLSTIGAGNGGTLCEVDWAKCKAAAGLRCSASCSSRAGTTVTIPDGLGTITGGR